MTSTICFNCEDNPGSIRLWSDHNLWICYDCLDWMNSQRARQTAGQTQPEEDLRMRDDLRQMGVREL